MQPSDCRGLSVSGMFQSSSGQKAGCNERGASRSTVAWEFQSSSGQKAGCNERGASRSTVAWEFQSSSGQKAGCNGKAGCFDNARIACFNPHPAFWPDATLRKLAIPCPAHVSILIRPEGRMQGLCCPTLTMQSSSGQKAGCNLAIDDVADDATVSILIRPEGRMQLLSVDRGFNATLKERSARLYSHLYEFQSSSGQKAGCNIRWIGLSPACPSMFQSSSGQKAGCNTSSAIPVRSPSPRFNPHPARRPDATSMARIAPIYRFQSSSGQKAGCNARRYSRCQPR